MTVWVLESPKEGHTMGYFVVCDSEPQAERVLRASLENGDTEVVCWDVVSGRRKR